MLSSLKGPIYNLVKCGCVTAGMREGKLVCVRRDLKLSVSISRIRLQGHLNIYTPKTTKNQFDPLKFGDYILWMAASDVLFSPLLICSNQHLLIPCVK